MRRTPSKLRVTILFILVTAMDNWSRTLRFAVMCLAMAISIAIMNLTK